MKFEVLGKPDFPLVKVNLEDGESIKAESGAMVGMSSTIQMETKAEGGILKSAKRMLGGESLFVNTYSAQGSAGEIYFTSATTGDIEHYRLEGSELFMSSGAYVCGSPTVEIDSKWGGARSFFSGEGLFILKASGTGDLFFSSFGAIHKVAVSGDYIVDTGHIVAFEPGLSYNIERVKGLKSLFLSGEGLVCRFSGNGNLYLQTRNQDSFAFWANQFRRIQASTND